MEYDYIKIGHHDYEIKFEDHVKTEDGELLDGKCDKHSKVITMSNDFKNKDFQKSVLLHEILHGIIYESGYQFESFEEEENFCYLVGKTLHGFMSDNAGLLHDLYKPNTEWLDDREVVITQKTNNRYRDILEGYRADIENEIKKQTESLFKKDVIEND